MQLLKSFVALATVLCAAVTGCGGFLLTASADREAQLTVAAPTEKLVVQGFNGSITVEGSDDVVDVQVTAKIRASGRDQKQAELQLKEAELTSVTEGGTLSITLDRPSGFSGSVSYDIKLPKGIAVVAETSNGSVEILNTQAAVEIATSNAAITVVDPRERIDVRTSNASVRVKGSSPIATRVVTSNGSISFQGALTGKDNRLETSNANVTAILSGSPVALTYKTSNATVTVDSEKQQRKGSLELGGRDVGDDAAKAALDVSTSNGSISIERTTSLVETEVNESLSDAAAT